MGIKIDPQKCTACMACEMACGFHRDDAFALLSSCIVDLPDQREKRLFRRPLKGNGELSHRPSRRTGSQKIGAVEEGGKGDASAKPMLLREPCDLCDDREGGPLCLSFCPVDAIYLD